jgi:methionine sulfoxide reductase catalytic subunit
MLIRHRSRSDPRPSEITPKALYLDRRRFIRSAAAAGIGIALAPLAPVEVLARGNPLPGIAKGPFGTDEPLTAYMSVTSYNNFYEFGPDKSDPARESGAFRPKPWTVAVDGLCQKPATLSYEDFVKPHPLEERVYRHRCVEAWSMVIPWVGFPLADVLKRFEPTGSAKYVAFETVVRPAEMPGQKRPGLDWPYVEGLRLDEAMHPLAILAVGLYGEELPNQNGAPLRLVVPWKYGFKSIKSIVRIGLTDKEPKTSWKLQNAGEYGFFSNVNPAVDHPRWSQATERRIGESGLFAKRRPTLPFNGYGEQVAGLYTGLDLKANY